MVGSDVIELSPSSRFHREPAQPTESDDGNSTFAERLLADIIADYPGPIIREDDQYDGGGDESAQSVAQTLVYQRLTNRSNLKLELHLQNSPAIRKKLGIEKVLDHTSYARAWKEQFSPGTRDYLEAYCGWIQDELDALDERMFEPFLPTEAPDHPDPLPEIPGAEIDQAIEHVKDIMLGTLDFDRGPNTTYDKSEILDPYTEAARERVQLNAILDEDEDVVHEMSLKTLLNSVQNREPEEWQALFEGVNSRVLDAAKGAGMLDRPVEVYGDITIIPFYPQNLERPDEARGNEKKKGTHHGFHFATLVAHDVDHNKDFIVAKTPYTPEKTPKSVIQELVGQAREHVSIKRMYLDSEFKGARLCSWLDNEGIEFVTRYQVRGDRIKGLLANMEGIHESVDDYAITTQDHKVTFRARLLAEPDWNKATEEVLQRQVKGNQQTFSDFTEAVDTAAVDISDIPKEMYKCRRPYITNVEDVSAKELLTGYNFRWRVENQYADVKRALLGKTQSRNHSMRVFFFWLSCILYNGWMLARSFLRMDFPDHAPRDRPPVSARKFVQKILPNEHG